MSQLATVTWLAVRELWISFRLLAVLGLLLMAGIAIALLPPAAAGGPAARYAALLGAAVWISAALAAATFAAERGRGSAGWVVGRGVPRSTLLLGWIAGFALAILAGLVPSAILAWVVLAGVGASLDPLLFGLTLAVVAAGALEALGVALLAGGLLAPPIAAGATLAAGAVVLAASLALPAAAGLLPLAGTLLLASALDGSPVGSLLRALGAGLVAAGLLVALARLALERAEL